MALFWEGHRTRKKLDTMDLNFLKSNFKAYPEVDNEPVQSYKPLLCISFLIIISDGQSEKFFHSNFEEILHSLVIPCLHITQSYENQ